MQLGLWCCVVFRRADTGYTKLKLCGLCIVHGRLLRGKQNNARFAACFIRSGNQRQITRLEGILCRDCEMGQTRLKRGVIYTRAISADHHQTDWRAVNGGLNRADCYIKLVTSGSSGGGGDGEITRKERAV